MAQSILIIGDDLRSFLSVVRSLGKCGIRINVVAPHASSPALSSRYIYRIHQLPPFYLNPKAWVKDLSDLAVQENIQLILPMTDQVMLPCVRYQDVLDPSVTLLYPGEKAFRLFQDKWKTHQLCEDVVVPHCQVWPAQGIIEDSIPDASYPLYLKPRSSADMKNLRGKQVVQQIMNADHLSATLEALHKPEDYFLEQEFQGIGVGISVLAQQGKLVQAFQHQRLSEGTSGGSSVRISTPCHPGMLGAVEALTAASALEGVAMFEFRFQPETDQFVLLEVNARFWGSLPLAIASGVNFPALLWAQCVAGAAAEGRTAYENLGKNYTYGQVARAFTPSFDDFRRAIERLGFLSKVLFFMKSIALSGARMVAGRESVDTFDWRDARPFFGEITALVKRIGWKVLQVVQLESFLRVRQRLNKARTHQKSINSVLILCDGNICRSPFLESYLKNKYPHMTVKSAGFMPMSGRSSPVAAQQVAPLYGVDLSSHQSQAVSTEMMHACDVILYFDAKNAQALKDYFPDYFVKSFCVGDFLTPAQDIPDPYGGNAEQFQDCYGNIQQAVKIMDEFLNS